MEEKVSSNVPRGRLLGWTISVLAASAVEGEEEEDMERTASVMLMPEAADWRRRRRRRRRRLWDCGRSCIGEIIARVVSSR